MATAIPTEACRAGALLSRLATVLLLFAALLAPPARADVWGFVDARGVAHFASERLDDRYELFFRSAETFDTTRDVLADVAQPPRAPAAQPMAPNKLHAFFEVSPIFKQVRQLLREASNDHNIDFELLQALIAAESGFDSTAVSPKGAIGLMQIMPATARRYGVDGDRKMAIEKKLFDPKTNIRTGTRYLRDLINMFPGQLEVALASYNAGEGAVQRAGNQIPNYKETQAYVKTVMQFYTLLKPPVPVLVPEVRPAPSRVRPAITGGALNRGNMPPSVAPVIKPKTESDN
ncbi:MAG: lytic transglycosylase domain-containing protein [Rhodoferax sp.]|nr:lytic transglycosylase domain-containing protein [Rhodoferax sp.]